LVAKNKDKANKKTAEDRNEHEKSRNLLAKERKHFLNYQIKKQINKNSIQFIDHKSLFGKENYKIKYKMQLQNKYLRTRLQYGTQSALLEVRQQSSHLNDTNEKENPKELGYRAKEMKITLHCNRSIHFVFVFTHIV
jgi:hypothetical protein